MSFVFTKRVLTILLLSLFVLVVSNCQVYADESKYLSSDTEDTSEFEVEKGPDPTTYIGCEDRYAREVKICQTVTCFARLFNRLSHCQKTVLARLTHGDEKRKMFIDGDLSELDKEELYKRHQTEKMRTKNKKAAEDAAASF